MKWLPAISVLLISFAAMGQTQPPEQRQSQLEMLAGDSLFQLGQLRIQLAQAKQEIEALKAKCGKACEPE